MKRNIYTLRDHIQESLKNPEFKKEWEKSELVYQLSRTLIKKRLAQNISQTGLAKKANTTQAVISRLENMSVNPSLGLLQRIARALNVSLKIQFE
ncbi:MAG: helix-turn-helix transcriptional regulator [Patescibacteria group bacterium]